MALISSAPSDVPGDWFLTNDMMAQARATVNARLGGRRLLTHAIFTPRQPGWMEALDRALVDLKPDSMKGYTIGDNTNKDQSRHPWRLDDEKLLYPAYEKMAKAGVVNVCIHKGLFAPALDQRFPNLRAYCDVRDVGKAAKDWPQLNFIIYHGAYRFAGGGDPADALAQFEQSGRVEWVTDLAEIPGKYGVTNVYADLGQLFALTTVAQPRLTAALMGTLVRGMGVDHIIWGTDAVWTGAPQWQIEGLRRLEIPEEMQKKHGFAPLGAADGPVKTAIFGENVARLHRYDRRAELAGPSRLAELKAEYERRGLGRSNRRYGYVVRGRVGGTAGSAAWRGADPHPRVRVVHPVAVARPAAGRQRDLGRGLDSRCRHVHQARRRRDDHVDGWRRNHDHRWRGREIPTAQAAPEERIRPGSRPGRPMMRSGHGARAATGPVVGPRARGPQHEQGERDQCESGEAVHARSLLLLPLDNERAQRFPGT